MKGCGKAKELSAFYTKGKGNNGVVRYESICKMCKKKNERDKYKSSKRSRQFRNGFSLVVAPGAKPDGFQRDKALKVLRDVVLEALGK